MHVNRNRDRRPLLPLLAAVLLLLLRGGECGLACDVGPDISQCRAFGRGINMKGAVLELNVEWANDCASCATACDNTPGCNVWVLCDNPNGCNNGNGEIIDGYTCTLKKADEKPIIVNPEGGDAVYQPDPALSDASFGDWISGHCGICPCKAFCGSVNSCSVYLYCEATGECVYDKVQKAIDAGITDCDPEATDCVVTPPGCPFEQKLCPSSSRLFWTFGEEEKD